MPSRRRTLALVAAAAVPAGCSALPSGTGDETPTPPSLEDGDSVRAQASGLDVERDLSLGDHETFVAANRTVRYPKTTSGGGEFTYDHVSLGTYLELAAGDVATDVVAPRLADELADDRLLDVGMTGRENVETTGGDRESPAIEIQHRTYTDDGDVAEAPAVDAGRVAVVAPRTVAATVRLRDGSHEGTYPVFVRKIVTGYTLGDPETDAT